jgi:serine/threonine-protein kinase RsbW
LKLHLPQQAQLQVNTDLSALNQVLAWFDQFSYPTVPRSVWLQCQLALAEGFTNAVRHAHKGKSSTTPINIEVTVLENALELRIWDFGAECDLKQLMEKLPPGIDKEAEGGRGLKLMKRMADVLSYTRMPDGRNCLLIIKHYPKNLSLG